MKTYALLPVPRGTSRMKSVDRHVDAFWVPRPELNELLATWRLTWDADHSESGLGLNWHAMVIGNEDTDMVEPEAPLITLGHSRVYVGLQCAMDQKIRLFYLALDPEPDGQYQLVRPAFEATASDVLVDLKETLARG